MFCLIKQLSHNVFVQHLDSAGLWRVHVMVVALQLFPVIACVVWWQLSSFSLQRFTNRL